MKKVHKLRSRILCLLLVLCMGSPALRTLAVSQETQEQIDRVKQEKEEAEEQKKEAVSAGHLKCTLSLWH